MARLKPPIEPLAVDFDDLLSLDPFRVPPYQRAFDWDTDEVGDFVRDARALVRCEPTDEQRHHFFGAVISVYRKGDRYFEIVDGQQRLTTEILCLSELKSAWSTLEVKAQAAGKRDLAKTAHAHAQKLTERLRRSSASRLTLSKRDEPFFTDLLGGVASQPARGSDESHQRLWAARATIHEELFGPLLEGVRRHVAQQARLEAIEQALLHDGYVVHLYTEDQDQAYRLFSVLNDRGRPLSVGSLLRTHTLAVLDGFRQEQVAAESDWDAILRVGETFVNAFLAAYYTSFAGRRVSASDMYDSFRRRFLLDAVHTATEASKLRKTVGNLKSEMDTFSQVRTGEWPFENSTKPAWERDRLRRLVYSLRHNLAHPLLLATARECGENVFKDLVLLLEPFVFRYINICGGSPARLAAVYYDHAAEVRKTRKLNKNRLRKDLRALAKKYAPDDVFEPLLREQLRFAKNSQRRQLIKHFLTTVEDYEEWFSSGASGRPHVKTKAIVFDLDQVNIEHIYPQSAKVVEQKLEERKHELGNLTALDDREGGKAGNAPFAQKRSIYAKSRFAITEPLGALAGWDDGSVASRFSYYAERAKRIFVVA
jgi:hypothetical protein